MQTNWLYYVLALLVLSSPFVALFIHFGKLDGWKFTMKVYGLTILAILFVAVVVILGFYLLHLANPAYFFWRC